MLRKLLPLAAITATALASGGAPAAERAGETTRVQPQSYQKTGVYPFNLRRGDDIYRNANVYTKENGSVSMLFDDGTDLTLGPNTDVTIDEYVYSPGGGGQMAISFGKGLLRMVSGRMPHENVGIATPVATVGIRGTNFAILLGSGLLEGWVVDGTVTATPNESGQLYAFTAPAAFACNSGSCEQIDGAPPPPGAFPASSPDAGFGFGSGGRGGPDGEGGDGGHDSGSSDSGGEPGLN